MARNVSVQLFDDLGGGSAAETVAFGLDGRAYEIDLSAANAAELRSELDRSQSHQALVQHRRHRHRRPQQFLLLRGLFGSECKAARCR